MRHGENHDLSIRYLVDNRIREFPNDNPAPLSIAEFLLHDAVQTQRVLNQHFRQPQPQFIQRLLAREDLDIVVERAEPHMTKQLPGAAKLDAQILENLARLAEAINKVRTVPPDNEFLKTAQSLGICLGN